MTWPSTALLLSILLIPLLPALLDIVPRIRATRTEGFLIPSPCPEIHDFTVLVPIYGNIRYLETVDFLSRYSSRVALCTTDAETVEFNEGIDRISGEHGFRVWRFPVSGSSNPTKRQVSGTIRDQLMREAAELVDTPFVVCIDADTTTERPLEDLVGALEANSLDLATVRLVPCNTGRLLGRLQAHEYRMAMRMRRVMPYLVSGAIQISRRGPLREIMRRHSLFFQGQDAEMGFLATSLGYRVGFLPFNVPTIVPDRPRSWWRQRFAWAGGEFRLYVVNFRLVRRHPFFILYGALVILLMTPLRWDQLWHPGYGLITVLAIYLAVVGLVNWRGRDRSLLLYPFYGLFNCLVMAPLGVLSYVIMATRDRNVGLIRAARS